MTKVWLDVKFSDCLSINSRPVELYVAFKTGSTTQPTVNTAQNNEGIFCCEQNHPSGYACNSRNRNSGHTGLGWHWHPCPNKYNTIDVSFPCPTRTVKLLCSPWFDFAWLQKRLCSLQTDTRRRPLVPPNEQISSLDFSFYHGSALPASFTTNFRAYVTETRRMKGYMVRVDIRFGVDVGDRTRRMLCRV